MTIAINKPTNEKSRMLRFAIVGGIGTVVDFGIFNLLVQLMGMDKEIAQAISFGFAVINNFVLNRTWTFPDARGKNLVTQLIQFAVVSVLGLIIRTPIFIFTEKMFTSIATQWLPNFIISPEKIGYNLALATAILIVMIWNFVVNRYWTFREVK